MPIELTVSDEFLEVETAHLLRRDAKEAVRRLAESPDQGLTVVPF